MLDITTLAAWGEFIGGIAVVVSLIYLASQIRQNSRLVRSSSASTDAQNANSWSTLVAQDPELARIALDGNVDRESLSEIDRRRFDALTSMTFESLNQRFEFIEDKVASARTGERLQLIIAQAFQQPGIRSCWREWGAAIFAAEFRDYVDSLIREIEAAE